MGITQFNMIFGKYVGAALFNVSPWLLLPMIAVVYNYKLKLTAVGTSGNPLHC